MAGSPRFKGDTEFRETPDGFHLMADEVFGLDVARVTFRGRDSKALSFTSKIKKGAQLSSNRGNPKMFVTGRSFRNAGPFLDVTIIFQGSWDGTSREPVVTRSIQVQSATLTTDEGERVSVLYRAQVVTARYFQIGSAPTTPKSSGFLPSELQATPFNWDPPKKTLKGRLRTKFVARNVLFEVESLLPSDLHRVTEQTILELEDS